MMVCSHTQMLVAITCISSTRDAMAIIRDLFILVYNKHHHGYSNISSTLDAIIRDLFILVYNIAMAAKTSRFVEN